MEKNALFCWKPLFKLWNAVKFSSETLLFSRKTFCACDSKTTRETKSLSIRLQHLSKTVVFCETAVSVSTQRRANCEMHTTINRANCAQMLRSSAVDVCNDKFSSARKQGQIQGTLPATCEQFQFSPPVLIWAAGKFSTLKVAPLVVLP